MKIRGFEIAKGFENDKIIMPKRATLHSAGYDIHSAEKIIIQPNKVVLIPTGIKAYMQTDEVLKIFIRSSMAVKRQLMLANNVGIIDCDYYGNESNDGHIMIAVVNLSDKPIKIEKDERIAQGIFEKYLVIDSEQKTRDKVKPSRNGGFGSSGTK